MRLENNKFVRWSCETTCVEIHCDPRKIISLCGDLGKPHGTVFLGDIVKILTKVG